MAQSSYKDKLGTEIDIEKEKLKKIESVNDYFKSLRTDENRLRQLTDSFFSRVFRSETIEGIRNEISRKKDIIRAQCWEEVSSKTVQELTNHIKYLEASRNNISDTVQWIGYPARLDKHKEQECLEKFRNLPNTITKKVGQVNITMFGGVGVGKSSFLNTVVTALWNNPDTICRDYKSAPSKTGKSKTKQFQIDSISVKGRGPLPINFYDCPGIDEDEYETMNVDVLEAILKGHVRGDSEFNPLEIMKKDEHTYRKHPELQNEIHCVVFVIKATTNLNNRSDEALKKIKEVQRRISGPRDVRQVAIVTNIDHIGVPNTDMEHVFKYKPVRTFCEEVAVFLEIDIHSVHPVANYNEELVPNTAKNVMALMALWNIFENGKRHVQKKTKDDEYLEYEHYYTKVY